MAQQGKQTDLASVMYPALSREAKAREAQRERNKQTLLRNLRELNQRVRLERKRERASK